MAGKPADRFDLMDGPLHGQMLYNVIIESYHSLTGEVEHTTIQANSLTEADAIEHSTDSTNACERRVTIVPDVLEYLRRNHPGCLERLKGRD